MLTVLKLRAYDEDDKLCFSTCTTIQDLAKNIENYEDYYYRLGLFEFSRFKTQRKKQTVHHFGLDLTTKGEFKMSIQTLTEHDLNSFIQKYREKNKRKRKPDTTDYLQIVLYQIERYSAVMNNASKSTHKDIEKAIKVFKSIDNGVKLIRDLNVLDGISGIYLLILDNYNLCYVGQAANMKKRILNHWQKSDGTRIDMFKALDTTRIYALPLLGDDYIERTNAIEHELVERIPDYVTINVMAGGKPDWLEANGLSV